jgi:hypothetical protein
VRPPGAVADGAPLDARDHSSAGSRTVAETDKIEDPLQRWQERRRLTAALNAEQADQARAAERGGVVAVDADGTLTDLDVFAQAIADLDSAGAEPSAVYLAPATWRRLSQLKKSADSNEPLVSAQLSAIGRPARAILGVPVLLSATMPAAQAVVAQASEIVVVRRSDLQVDVDEHLGSRRPDAA